MAADQMLRSHLSLFHPAPLDEMIGLAAGIGPDQILWVIDQFRRQRSPWRFGPLKIDCPENAFCSQGQPEIIGLVHSSPDSCFELVMATGYGPLAHELVSIPGRLPEDRYRPAGEINDLRFVGVVNVDAYAKPALFHARPDDPSGPFTEADVIHLAGQLSEFCKTLKPGDSNGSD